MLGAQVCPRSTLHGLRLCTDQPTPILRTPNPFPNRISLRLLQPPFTSFKPKSVFVTCKYSRGSFSPKSHHDHGNEYLEAIVLISETVKNYQLLKQGFQEEVNWNLSGHSLPLSQATCPTIDNSLGLEFLRHFQSPTVFLKISCDGEFLLPIVVGRCISMHHIITFSWLFSNSFHRSSASEKRSQYSLNEENNSENNIYSIFAGEHAIEKLMDSLHKDDNWDCPNLFQFARNLVTQLGYQINMVKITERVDNTYYSRIYFSKVGERETFSIDARPSDALNLARRCKAPIYVNKQVVLTDAIRISYRAGQVHGAKPCYDVQLDSAPEGPNLLAEELDVVKNLHLAVREERYLDAAMLRDKLINLQKSS